MHRWQFLYTTDSANINPPFPKQAFWSFDQNKAYVSVVKGNVTDTILWGDYTLKNRVIIISGPNTHMTGGELFMGNFQIMRVNDSELVLARREDEDGLLYFEFVKAD